jgi:hypothetical protein
VVSPTCCTSHHIPYYGCFLLCRMAAILTGSCLSSPTLPPRQHTAFSPSFF